MPFSQKTRARLTVCPLFAALPPCLATFNAFMFMSFQAYILTVQKFSWHKTSSTHGANQVFLGRARIRVDYCRDCNSSVGDLGMFKKNDMYPDCFTPYTECIHIDGIYPPTPADSTGSASEDPCPACLGFVFSGLCLRPGAWLFAALCLASRRADKVPGSDTSNRQRRILVNG